MSILAAVQARVPTSVLIQLTRPKDETATQSVDTTLLGYACDDAEADIETYCGVSFSDYSTDNRFLRLAVWRVLIILREYAPKGPGDGKAGSERERWEKDALALSKVTGRNRIGWTTSSNIPSSTATTDSEAFSSDFWRGYQPNPRSTDD